MQTFTNKFEVPLPLALWIAVDEYEPSKYNNELSATGLLKSPRYIIAQLRQKNPELFDESVRPVPVPLESIELPDIQERVAARIGTAIHSSVEKAWKDYYKQGLTALGYPEKQIDRIRINPTEPEEDTIPVFQENRMYKQIEVDGVTFTISGQYDMIINGVLHDIKSTSTYSYENGANDEKYRKQGSIYRWLNPNLITGDYLTINFVFLDFKKFLDQRNGNYPPARAYFKQYKLLSVWETEMFIRNKLKQLVKYWNYPLEQIPCCQPEDLFTDKPIYKYYKNGYEEGKRSTKNFDTFAEASAYRAKQGFVGVLIEDRGKPFMCPCCIPEEVEQMSLMAHKHTKLEIS